MLLTYDGDGNAYVTDQNGIVVDETPYNNIESNGEIIDQDTEHEYTTTFFYNKNARNRDLKLINNETADRAHFTGKIFKIFGKSSADLQNGDTEFEIKVNNTVVYTINDINVTSADSFEVFPDITVVQGDLLKVRITGDTMSKPLVYVIVQR